MLDFIVGFSVKDTRDEDTLKFFFIKYRLSIEMHKNQSCRNNATHHPRIIYNNLYLI